MSSGQLMPAAGYEWANGAPADYTVVWTPGKPHPVHMVLAGVEPGTWRPAPGYRWVSSAPGDYRVEPDDGQASRRNGASGVPDGRAVQRIRDLAALGLDGAASWTEIEAAFRRLVRVHHPDRFANAGAEAIEAAERAFVMLRAAYERLKTADASGR